jgi:hypothetical protein
LLPVLTLEACFVTIDVTGTPPSTAQAIRDHGADYVLAVKDKPAHLCKSLRDFFTLFQNTPGPPTFYETLKKDPGRIEHRRCYAFAPFDRLLRSECWLGLKSFTVIESSRFI